MSGTQVARFEVRKNGERVRLNTTRMRQNPPRTSLWGRIKSFIVRWKNRNKSMEAITEEEE